jgi:uncharacterized membrane protein
MSIRLDGVGRASSGNPFGFAPVSLTLFCWWKPHRGMGLSSNEMALMGNWTGGSFYNCYLFTGGGGANQLGWAVIDNTGAGRSGGMSIPAGVNGWNSGGWSWTSTTMRLFSNGKVGPFDGLAGSSLRNATGVGIHLGSRADSNAFFVGLISQAAVWVDASTTRAALTHAEMRALMDGASPLSIRPGQLWAYWPFARDLKTRAGYPGGSNYDVSVVTSPVRLTSEEPDVLDRQIRRVRLVPALAVTPVADFTGTPTSGTASLSVAFTDTSTNTPTSWAWDFGDGSTSTSQNPSHSYTSSGVYTVSLTATNTAGSNTKTRTAYITVSEPVVYATGGGIDIW